MRRCAVAALAALLVAASAGCEALVRFDPIDSGTIDGADAFDDGAGEADVDADAPDRADAEDGRFEDGPGPDGDADGDEGVDEPDAEGADEADVPEDADAAEDAGPVCGNGIVEPPEECEGSDTQACTTACSTAGTQACVGCRWGACATSDPEVCNGLDDDCDGLTDEDFDCIQGQTVDCTMFCGSTGTTVCDASCMRGTCVAPVETCNGRDDDCDTEVDEDFDCIAGATVPCNSSCATLGSGTCSATCTVPGPAACTPPAETCNGLDDDCDGLTDEGLWAAGPVDVRVTHTALDSVRPALAWNATAGQFGLAYEDDYSPGPGGEIYFALLDGSGVDQLSPDDHVSTFATSVTHQHPALALAGTEWGVVWSRSESGTTELHFRSVAGDGSTMGSDAQVTSAVGASDEPSLAWMGSEYGLAWNDGRIGNLEIYFTRLTSVGTHPGTYVDQRLTNTTCISSRPSVAWTGTQFGVAWSEICSPGDPGDIYFTRVDSSGAEIVGAQRAVVVYAGAASTWPRLAWNGAGFGMVWLDDRDGTDQLYFARLDAVGVVLGSIRPLTALADTIGVDGPASIVWNTARQEYVVAWSDKRNAGSTCGGSTCGPEIYFARISTTGGVIDAAVRVTTAAGISTSPWLADTGSGYGLVWTDQRDAPGFGEIYFNTLRCR